MDSVTNFNVSNRKIRKPLMERKRRARINHSLDELHQLLTETNFASKGSKLEKADILELTVEYFKQIKQNDYSKEMKENLDNVLMERYLLGYERCAEEIEAVVEPPLRERINRHLKSCIQKVKFQRKVTTGKTCDVTAKKHENSCSVVIQKPKDLRILPSKLPNGDVLLLLSSNMSKSENRFNKVWRPWW